VIQTTADELIRADRAFSGNRLLSTFSSEARALVEPYGEMVELKSGEVVLTRGNQVRASLFPVGQTMISMTVELSGGRTAEVASVGREGAVGGIVSCGHAPAFSRSEVLMPGAAFRVSMNALEDAKNRSPFIANLFCRFSDYLLSQVMQSAACNAFRWSGSSSRRAARSCTTCRSENEARPYHLIDSIDHSPARPVRRPACLPGASRGSPCRRRACPRSSPRRRIPRAPRRSRWWRDCAGALCGRLCPASVYIRRIRVSCAYSPS